MVFHLKSLPICVIKLSRKSLHLVTIHPWPFQELMVLASYHGHRVFQNGGRNIPTTEARSLAINTNDNPH